VSAVSDAILVAVAPIARLVANILDGKVDGPEDVARALIGAALDSGIPAEELREFLTEEARARQEALFEASKDAKYGPAP